MSTPLICDNCGQEIKPGTNVRIIDPEADEIDGPRIIADGDALITHVECPVQ